MTRYPHKIEEFRQHAPTIPRRETTIMKIPNMRMGFMSIGWHPPLVLSALLTVFAPIKMIRIDIRKATMLRIPSMVVLCFMMLKINP